MSRSCVVAGPNYEGKDVSKDRNPRRRKPATQKVGLDRSAVIDAALEILDEEGLGSLTIRRVARQLDVWPTTIYWHVAHLDNLLSAVVSRVTQAAAGESATGDWRADLRETARSYRAAVHEHPNIAPVLVTVLGTNSGLRFPLVERYLSALVSAGFRGDALVHAYNAFFGAVVGFVSLELAGASSSPNQEWKEELQRDVENLSTAQYPTLAEEREVVQGRIYAIRWRDGVDQPFETSFETLLDALITGLESLPDGQ